MNYLITIGFNHDKFTKQENFLCGKNLLLIDVNRVSSVSARKLRCPSLARLSSQPSQLGSARLLGNFSSNSSLIVWVKIMMLTNNYRLYEAAYSCEQPKNLVTFVGPINVRDFPVGIKSLCTYIYSKVMQEGSD